ncbi:Alpha/Beta hydrolase protein [Plectosphaerella cucumerina]|uniref:Alpha/Beta hydrolase protein n=1 Tax=Plectosphaerella cucumerina TaxID=40658 RepID=A0A8K0TMU5_9PEZI|nr:Alpha/Beta hydrolase protein [Plectosphaerella cucumerina]
MSSTSLDNAFEYQNATHSYTIKWTSLGAPEAPPLVFIHGTPWSSRVWEPFAIALSRQFHVYLFDNPGFGESPIEKPLPGTTPTFSCRTSELDADLARQSEAFSALFQSWQADWGEQQAHVVAHDHAGLMSLRAHLLHDCQYASLCLIDVVAIGPFGQSLFKSVAENPRHYEGLPDVEFEEILERYIRDAAFAEVPKETMDMLKKPWLSDEGKRGFVRQLCQADSRNTDAVEGRYGEVGKKMPIKIIWGSQDRWIPVETAQRLGDALGAREVVAIEGAGHLIMYDQAAQLGVELGRWLGGLEASLR